MLRTLLISIWLSTLALVAFGETEHWHLLIRPLTVAMWGIGIGTVALGCGSIIHCGIGLLRLRRELRTAPTERRVRRCPP